MKILKKIALFVAYYSVTIISVSHACNDALESPWPDSEMGYNNTLFTDVPGDGTSPWDGYADHVGLKYVMAKWDNQSNYHSDLDTYLGEIQNVDIRVKVSQKGGIWPGGDTCVTYYLSGNRDFETSDVYLGQECHGLYKDKYDDKDEVSFYLNNINIAGNGKIDTAKKYFLFAIIEYDGGINASTENDGSERVGITVGGYKPHGYVDELSCNTVRGWAKDEDRPYGGIKVHVYASNPDGSQKEFVDSFTASTYRGDLGGYYAWDWSIPGKFKKGQSKKYYFYGINEPEGTNPLLTFNSVNVPTDTLKCDLCPGLTYERCIAAIMLILD